MRFRIFLFVRNPVPHDVTLVSRFMPFPTPPLGPRRIIGFDPFDRRVFRHDPLLKLSVGDLPYRTVVPFDDAAVRAIVYDLLSILGVVGAGGTQYLEQNDIGPSPQILPAFLPIDSRPVFRPFFFCQGSVASHIASANKDVRQMTRTALC